MARFTIKSKIHGDQTFYVPDNGGYVRLESPGKTGTLAQQICVGGGYRGNTLESQPENLEAVARRWWRQSLKRDRECR